MLINEYPSEGVGPCFVELNKAENLLSVANYASGNIAVYIIQPNGAISKEVQTRQHSGSGPVRPNQVAAHAHCTKFDVAGKFLYAVDLVIDKVLSYPIDADGKLGEQQIALRTDAGDGPRHLIWHPTKNIAFVINELSSSVISALVDTETGNFQRIDKKGTLPLDFEGDNNCADIHISTDARFLYASNRGHNSIAIFSVSEDGHLQLIANEFVQGDWLRNFNLAPDGRHLLVANRKSNNITVFKIDPTSGLLSYTGNQVELSQPVCLKFN